MGQHGMLVETHQVNERLKNWRELEPGAVMVGVNADVVYNGGWRTYMPIFIPDKCINCMICWFVCPDRAIVPSEKGDFGYFDYNHCKGCGLCGMHCPVKAIDMKLETDVDKTKIPNARNLHL
jgi:2-oxoacid:acceptor oxidoreductase delta subunit (pyruvate/2-ketoisovalerate family)